MKRLIPLLLVCLSLIPTPALGQGDDDGPSLAELNEENIKQATVFVMQVRDNPTTVSCVGTGTLVSADGLILTNAHLVESTETCPSDRIIVGLSLRPEEPPVPTYVADVLEFSRGLDLAVLRITSFLDGRLIETGALQLPFVELGDSNLVNVDDTVLVVGYPGIENDPVQSSRATITGFTAEANFGERAWIRTSAEIPGVMSGGGMYDSGGRLIGIPTIAPTRIAGSVLDCREVYDTNGDGQISNEDSCIPIGGAISAVRPVRLARGLVRAAALSIELGQERAPVILPPPESEPTFGRLFITTGVNEAGMPVNVVSRVPTGTNSMYVFFDYDNMEDGMVYELRVTIDGRPDPIESLPPATWSGGRKGMWYIGGSRVPRPNGSYQYTLFIDGRQAAISDPVQVGGAATESPQFSDLIFGLQNALQEFVEPNYVIPEGNIIRARFSYRNMRPGLQWRQVWYQGDAVIRDETLQWTSADAQGSTDSPAIESPVGFPSSRYRLELYIVDEDGNMYMTATSDFVVAGGAGGANDAQAQIFDNFRFAQGQRANLPLGVVAESFPRNTESIYVFFNWRQIENGTPWTWRWYIDGELLFESNTRWSEVANGENYFISLVGEPTLPEATYTFEIEINGIVMTSPEETETEVGIGQLPVDTFASAEGVRVSGFITDAETGNGIPGAIFIILQADFDVSDFIWDAEQVLALAETDGRGFFQMEDLVPRGTLEEPILYSVVVRADGYLPVSADGIPVTDVTESPLSFNIELNQD